MNNIKNLVLNKYLLILTLTGLLIQACTDDTPLISDQDLIVVWAYLYNGEQAVRIKLTSTLPLDADTTAVPPINDAQVALLQSGQRYNFEPAGGDSGHYCYPGDDLAFSAGDQFEIEVWHNDQVVTASTVIPPVPEEIDVNSSTMTVPNFGDIESMMEWRDSEDNEVVVTWVNDADNWYYVTIVNVDPNPVAIDNEFGKFVQEFIFPPINDDEYRIRMPSITHLGRHKITVYRVNQEYVDLYESQEQDSRDLNEPLTNVENGLGIFTAFSSDSVFIQVSEAN